MALHHGVLPPTIKVDAPNPKLELGSSPFYLNTKARPWIRATEQHPRRAGVSAFGFGGSNFHVVLEGYTDNREPEPTDLSYQRAETVRNLLQAELPGLYFEIIPRGAMNPIAPNDTPYGRQRNRRVQIYLAAEEKAEDAVEVVTTPDGE